MTPYPKSFPIESAQIFILVSTEGIQPEGQHGDLACVFNAAWDVLGFGLGVWKPHEHNIRKGTKKFTAPRTQDKQIKKMAELLTPVTPSEAEVQTTVKGDVDFNALPWDQIILIAITIIRSLLNRKT
jgi:hypothetical protein